MDEQLKRRLMGATIVTALAVIFVPMLFEDKSAGPSGGAPSEIPALPEPIEQRAIDLPKSAADVAPAEESAGKETKRAPETGYRIVPLDDAPPKPAKPAPAPSAQNELEAPPEEDFTGDEGGEAPEEQPPAKAVAPAPKTAAVPNKAAEAKPNAAPGKKSKAGAVASAPGPAAKAPDGGGPLGVEPSAPGEDEAAPPAQPPKPKAARVAGKPAEGPPKKSEKAKPANAPPPKSAAAKSMPVKPAEPPVAKSAAPKPAPVAEPADVDDMAAPLVKPATAKPAVPAAPRPASAEAAKPSPASAPAPVKAKEPARATSAPPAGVPSSWVVQAGSFTGEANARALADKLRKQNLPAYVHVSHKESGDIYRVTVGPELNRTRAEQIQKQIESSVGIKGMILPHR